MTIHATIETVNGERKSKLFSGWPAMLAYITDNWKDITEFSARLENVKAAQGEEAQ